MYPVAVEGSAAGSPHHHRSSALTALVLGAGGALLVASMLAGIHRAADAPEQTPLDVPRSSSTLHVAPTPAAGGPEVDTPIFEQFIQLDEVLITITGEEGPESEQERSAADR